MHLNKFLLKPPRNRYKHKKIYFDRIICNKKTYSYLEEINTSIINLLVLTLNRKPKSIFLLSNNIYSLTTAMISGFGVVPFPGDSEYELAMASEYIL